MNRFMLKFGVRVFHHVLLKYGNENSEIRKRKFDDVALQYNNFLYTFDIIQEPVNEVHQCAYQG